MTYQDRTTRWETKLHGPESLFLRHRWASKTVDPQCSESTEHVNITLRK